MEETVLMPFVGVTDFAEQVGMDVYVFYRAFCFWSQHSTKPLQATKIVAWAWTLYRRHSAYRPKSWAVADESASGGY